MDDVTALASALAGFILMRASMGRGLGGHNSAGEFIDLSGNPVDTAPMQVNLTLGPSSLFYLSIFVLVLLVVSRVARKGIDDASAARIMFRGQILIIGFAVICIAVGVGLFLTLSIPDDITHWTPTFPFPFASISQHITPMAPLN